jgi:dihydrodipicolinate synthase/N-acetylneuraminate lyase
MQHRSLIVAALTPRGKRGELNFGACFELIDHLCKANVPGIALLTAAGEYPAFTLDERTRLVYLAVKRSRAPLLAGVGSEFLETSVALAREALGAGAEGVLLPPPLLFQYRQAELREYYLHFAAQLGRSAPIWIDDPAATITGITPILLATGQFAGVVRQDMMLSAEACAIPELFVAYDCALRTGDHERAAHLAALVSEFQAWVDRFAPLIVVKAAMGLRGIAMGSLAVPIAEEWKIVLGEFEEWFRAWLPGIRKTAANTVDGKG